MYISKNDLIKRLIELTGKSRSEFATETRESLLELYESYVSNGERTYINVPYRDKDIVKLFGARYDGDKKKWYVPSGVDINLFSKWL